MATRPDSNEIRLTRVYDVPVHAVWDAWTLPEQTAMWWGPRGFTLTTHHKDLRVGGTWRYTMHGPDGIDYPNVATYHVVQPHRRLVYDHGATDDRPPLFRVDVTFAESDGKTTMDMCMTLPSPEAAAQTARFIQKAGGNATWDRLAEHLAETLTGKRCFGINRSLPAPIEQVFERWVKPEHLARWLPPPGTTMRFLRPDIAAGSSSFFVITGDQFSMHVRTHYQAIDTPRRIVYTQQFVDEREQLAPGCGPEVWPATLMNTVLFAEQSRDHTRVTLTTEVHGSATPAEIDAFVLERPGMTLGWTHSFDELEALLG